ncbi:hypothetical protein IEQ34_006376 [Dendrobium chrysotoxum]|uniref:Uncharacterized protein n=1 Tax=Dendrobium chrysotoxum TaxID=161865 RepID=A0AAV7HDZ2_DENCH|nr:hypothetical protein IEQ34_006376 [Dendrobium chrysotoxum]
MRRAFRPAGETLKQSKPLGRIGSPKIDDVDHLFPFHCFQNSLVRNEEGETKEGTEINKEAAGGGGGGGVGGNRIQGAVKARP